MNHLIKLILTLSSLYFLLFYSSNASTLNLEMTSSPSRLNPILANDSASNTIAGWLFNGLFKYDKEGNIAMDLAIEYEFITKTK